MDRDDVIALVRAIGGPDRADPVCPQGDMITLDVDEVVRLVNIAAAQQFDASLTDPTNISVHQTAEPSQPFCYLKQTSSSENPPHGWAVHFTEGDVALYTAPQPPGDVPPMTDEDFVKIAFPYLDGALMEEIEMDGYALLEILRAVEAEVRRRCGVVE